MVRWLDMDPQIPMEWQLAAMAFAFAVVGVWWVLEQIVLWAWRRWTR